MGAAPPEEIEYIWQSFNAGQQTMRTCGKFKLIGKKGNGLVSMVGLSAVPLDLT